MGKSAGNKWRACAGPALLATLILAVPARAQITVDAYRDYFLYGRFGEVCTMCEVIVLCQAGESVPQEDAVPSAGRFHALSPAKAHFLVADVNHLGVVCFQLFRRMQLAARGHTRPVHVYRVTEGSWSPREIIEGRLVLNPPVFEFGDRNIDRVTRAWSGADASAAPGYCSRLPLWDALESIEANAPGAGS